MTAEDKKPYQEMIRKMRERMTAIRDEMSALEIRKSDLQSEWENLNAAVSKFRPLAGEVHDPNDLSQLGFTDAIRTVILMSKERLSPVQIKEALAAKGFPISRYSDVMASIYKILSRIKDDPQIAVETEGFNVFYRRKRRGIRSGRRLWRLASPQNPAVKGDSNEPRPTGTSATDKSK